MEFTQGPETSIDDVRQIGQKPSCRENLAGCCFILHVIFVTWEGKHSDC
jgi:hypothetical protein